MEVKKTSIPSISQPEINPKSEVSKTKSSGQNLIPDSFETSKSSDTNHSSTASSEPEKKAGQITGGILIKQMTAARLGGTNVSGESSGKKELTPEQQSHVSDSNPEKENLKPSFFLQDARSRSEESKNSGLQPPFASNKGDASSKFPEVGRAVSKDQIIAASGQSGNEQTSNAVKDANRLVDGGSLRSQVDAEVAERHQDPNALGGSTNDRLKNTLDPTARGKTNSGAAYGKGAIAADGEDQNTFVVRPHPRTDRKSYQTFVGDHINGHTEFHDDITRYDKNGNVASKTERVSYFATKDEEKTVTTTTKADGTVIVNTKVVTYTTTTNKDGSTTSAPTKTNITETTTNKDGSTTTTTTETTTPGGGTKSYDRENYTGNIPEEVKNVRDYFRQQATAQKPQSGGETVHTDDSATGGTITGGSVSNLVVQQGNLGLLGNPGSATSQTGPSGGQGVGSSQSGGNVDYGPDSDKVGYTGPTHQDDPGDVQFGPQTPVAEGSVESKNADDTSNDSNILADILNRGRKKAQ